MSDYQKAIEELNNLPKFNLGEEVDTEFGKGVLVKMEMDFNGLYISPHTTKVVVWYSTDKAFTEGTKWVSKEFRLCDIKKISNKIEVRKHKINNL